MEWTRDAAVEPTSLTRVFEPQGRGGRLVLRSDDNVAAVRERLREYRARVRPILDLFGKKELVIAVDGARTTDDVQRDIQQQLSNVKMVAAAYRH